MNNKKFNTDLINKIKKENIKQTPKNVFLFKNIILWVFLGITIIIWAISLSISLEYLINADWYLLKRVGIFKIFFVFLPLFWVIFLIVSSILWYYNYRKTNRGYKLALIKIFIINVVSSLILAFFLYTTWVNSYIETKLENISPKYRSVLVEDNITRMVKVWQNEEQWLLIWELLEVNQDTIVLRDYNNKKWEIFINTQTTTDIKHKVSMEVWENIKIIWEKTSSNTFNAGEIRPLIWSWNNSRKQNR